jgi:hypothetical protein
LFRMIGRREALGLCQQPQPAFPSLAHDLGGRSVSPVKASAARSEGAGRSVGFGKFLFGLA